MEEHGFCTASYREFANCGEQTASVIIFILTSSRYWSRGSKLLARCSPSLSFSLTPLSWLMNIYWMQNSKLRQERQGSCFPCKIQQLGVNLGKKGERSPSPELGTVGVEVLLVKLK